MTDYRDAAARRAKNTRTKDTVGEPFNKSAVQNFLDAESGSSPQKGSMGFGPEFDEAMSKSNSGVNEPGPPQAVIRRIQAQKNSTEYSTGSS